MSLVLSSSSESGGTVYALGRNTSGALHQNAARIVACAAWKQQVEWLLGHAGRKAFTRELHSSIGRRKLELRARRLPNAEHVVGIVGLVVAVRILKRDPTLVPIAAAGFSITAGANLYRNAESQRLGSGVLHRCNHFVGFRA